MIETGLNAEPVDGPGPFPFPRATTGGGGGSEEAGEDVEPWVPGVGRVNVTTDGHVDDAGGRCWNVTFSSAVGAVGPMKISASASASASSSTSVDGDSNGNGGGSSRLTGLGAAASVETLQAGNTISGSFSIKFRGGGEGEETHETAQLSATASAAAVSEALLELPGVSFARTARSTPSEAVADGCSDGLCRVGPTPGGGLEWVVELGTRVGNTEPSSPTLAVWGWSEEDGEDVEAEGVFDWPEVEGGNLEGEGAAVAVRKGWGGAAGQLAASFNASQPFSVALGGVGASHGTYYIDCRLSRYFFFSRIDRLISPAWWFKPGKSTST